LFPRRVPVPSRLRAAARLSSAVALGLLASSLAAQEPGAARNDSWRDTTYVDAIIRIEFENGPADVIPALTYNSTLLLPLRQLLAMAHVRVELYPRDSAVVVVEPGSVRLLFLPLANTLLRSGTNLPYDSLNVVWWDGDLFVASRMLDELLDIRTSIEWTNLSAVVGHTAHLPVVRRARRERRRQLMDLRQPAPEVLDLVLRQRPVDGAVASWSFTAARQGPSEQMSLDLGLGGGLLGGAAELRPVIFSATGGTSTELRWAWSRVFTESQWVRQVRVGHIQTSGRRSMLTRGALITNAPFIRSSEFDIENLVTNVPAGWEAELYERGRLLAYADADAVGAFRTPLQLGYGQNPFEVVMYGPGGETVRQARTIRVPFSRIPTGRTEYSVALGRCRYDPCDALWSADVRRGVSSRLTLQGGWDAFFGAGSPSLWQPYAVASWAPRPALGVTGEAVMNGHLRAAADYEPNLDFRVASSYTGYARSAGRFGGSFAESRRGETSVFWRPGWMRGDLYLQGAGVYSAGPAYGRSLTRLSGTTRAGRLRYGLGVLHDEVRRTGVSATSRLAFDASVDAVLANSWRLLNRSAVQGQLAFEPSRGLTALRAILGRRVSRTLRMDAGVGWQRGYGVNLEVALATAAAGPRFGTRTRAASVSGSQALVYASGSAAWDPRTHLFRLSDMADLGRAGVTGILFRDDNGNGLQDPGEPGIPGIPVVVGGWPAETDASGRFAAWGLMPVEPLQIDFDTLSFEDPQLVLPAPVLRVRPAPNAFGSVSIPVVVGAEVSGYVLLGTEALAGVPVILRELNTGHEITVRTFSDGAFYRAAVPPGEYEVTLPEALLVELRVSAPLLHIFVPPGSGEKRFRDLALRLEPLQ
jgi:hypothetical protein